jgi:hypothetical protein
LEEKKERKREKKRKEKEGKRREEERRKGGKRGVAPANFSRGLRPRTPHFSVGGLRPPNPPFKVITLKLAFCPKNHHLNRTPCPCGLAGRPILNHVFLRGDLIGAQPAFT